MIFFRRCGARTVVFLMRKISSPFNMKFKNLKLKYKTYALIALLLLTIVFSLLIIFPNLVKDVIYQQITRFVFVLFIWTVAIFIILSVVNVHIVRPLNKIRKASRLASVGDLSQKTRYQSDDEIGQIAASIDNIIQNQLNLSEFSEKIGDGDFNVTYEVLSEKDKLGTSLTNMRDKLQKVAAEDTRRNWASEGISKFSEILRVNPDDLKILSDKILSNLVKYMDANQGAIFLMKEEERKQDKLYMISSYAWGRKKYIEKNIENGEGLLGQVAIEKETIYVTDIPDNYVNITSGLGDANPRSLLIVPLKYNDELYGVIELASFQEYENYQIELVERIAEITSSTVARVRVNERTQKLLKESQQLTEELRAQEEEMRQNMEEMNATQDEMQRREVERIGIFTAINNTLATVEFDMNGHIKNANDNFLALFNCSLEELEGKTDRVFSDKENEPIEKYRQFWDELRAGKLQRGDYKRITKDGREIWLNASYTPSLDKDGNPYKVIKLAQDITEKKRAELESKRQAEELRVQGEKLRKYTTELEDIKRNLSEKLDEASKGLKKKIKDIEAEKAKNIAVLEGCVDGVISFNQIGEVEYFNNAAEEIWGYERDDILGKKIATIIPIELEENEGGFLAYFSNNGVKKEVGVRTEVSVQDKIGNEIDLLVTLTRAKVEDDFTFTIFAQKISVDLF